MKVTRLEIFGFKSFMERTVIPFESGITAVVGPNGCGKSNVVDALMWVLGEARATKIRGDTLDDLIFNGTEKLRPLGLAEVTLTIKSAENDFFSDLVSPVLEAENVELEAAKKEIDRLTKDATQVIETPTEEGDKEEPLKPALRVIQGDLGSDTLRGEEVGPEISSEIPSLDLNKSSDQNEARKNTLLQRFSWLKATNEVQVTRRYYRSGESEYFINRVPCRLRDLVELFQCIGLGPRAYTIVAQDRVSKLVTAKPEDRRLILEEAAGVAGFRDRITAANRRLEETAHNIQRLDDITQEVSRQVSSLKRQANRAINRKNLVDQVISLEKELFADSYLELSERLSRVASLVQEKQELEANVDARVQKVIAEEHESRSELMRIDVESDEIRARIDSIKEELGVREASRQKSKNRLSEINTLLDASTSELVKLSDQERLLTERREIAETTLSKLQAQSDEFVAHISEMKIPEAMDISTINDNLKRLRVELRQKEEDLRKIRESIKENNSLATESIFRDVHVFETLDEAVRAVNDRRERGTGEKDTCITLDGYLVTASSYYKLDQASGIEELRNKCGELSSRCRELDDRQSTLMLERDALVEQIVALEKRYEEGVMEAQRRSEDIREITKEQGSVSGRYQAERRLFEQLCGDIDRTIADRQNSEHRRSLLEMEKSEVESRLASLVSVDESQMIDELHKLQGENSRIEHLKRDGRNQLSLLSERVDYARRDLDSARAECSNASLEFQKAQLEMGSLKSRVEELIPGFSELLESGDSSLVRLDDETRGEHKKELSRLKEKISREGDVDPTSIERYEEENRRFEELTQQKKDLEEASATLKRTLEKLSEVSKARFISTFHAVNENFIKLAARLFGGGSARLEMLDPANPLQTGVDIVVRPPGKKLKSIDVLSGGEKALTATALVFGMFLVRPSPLCVLDEVDAPLDDANVHRFLSLIKDMSLKTQFLMITHNKQSMAIANNLVGVTMEQPGISKTISVSLEEAYAQVA